MMATNALNTGVIKAIVSFYRVNSDTAFERHRSRIPINDLNTVHALKKHLVQFLGLKEPTIKYGLGDFDIKLYRMAPKPGGGKHRRTGNFRPGGAVNHLPKKFLQGSQIFTKQSKRNECYTMQQHRPYWHMKVARYSFSGSIPAKFEHKLQSRSP